MLQETSVPHSLRVEELVRLFQSYYPYTLPTNEILQPVSKHCGRKLWISTLAYTGMPLGADSASPDRDWATQEMRSVALASHCIPPTATATA
jgi:hypothetical protein